VTATRHEHSQDVITGKFPIRATALAASPARAGLPDKAPVPAPAADAAARPVDPRIAFSRNH